VTRARFLFALCVTLLASVVTSARAHVDGGPASYDDAAALETSQAALGRTLGDYTLTDTGGRALRIASLRGRPLIVSLVYTSCYGVCPTLTQHLASVAEIAREALGPDSFNLLTIGFDTAVDTPERMRMFAAERRIDMPGWHFASTDAATITDLTRELGFIYFASPRGFDHLTQTTVLDADGRVYRQIYGADFAAPLLVEPLKQLELGQRVEVGSLSSWLEGVRLFCTLYDPSSGRYRFDYSLFMSIAIGLLCLGSVALYIVREWRASRPAS
jgi:protein SCO1/2